MLRGSSRDSDNVKGTLRLTPPMTYLPIERGCTGTEGRNENRLARNNYAVADLTGNAEPIVSPLMAPTMRVVLVITDELVLRGAFMRAKTTLPSFT
jgi:hypothetical protein